MHEKNKIISDIRKDYGNNSFHVENLLKDPFSQFFVWYGKALEIGPLDSNTMTLATADASGKPSARIVLLKGVEDGGFIFYSNYESQKGKELLENPRATLLFYWKELDRQVRVDGLVEKISEEESTKYFRSRPKGSQISATASLQSSVIESKGHLETRVKELEETYKDSEVLPRPKNWGGYKLVPNCLEFWIGRPNRLHDRYRYALTKNVWNIERLSP